MLKKILSFILCPLVAAPIFAGTAFAAESKNDKPSEIVGEWMWASTIADLGENGAELIMQRCSETGITDVYLLVKGTGGTLGYLKTKYTDNLSRKNRDVLQEAIDAAHKRGIRLHAWICNMEDSTYKKAHPEAGMWHYIRERDNDKINLYDEGYRKYMTTVAAEVAAYDIDGLHLDYIRYNHLTNGWSEKDIEAMKAMGANIDRVKELIETTFGYHGKTASSNYVFNAYSSGDKDAAIIAKYRRNNVKEYAKAVIDAAKKVNPNLIISAAMMPEGAYNESYGDLHYGQSYDDAAELYDYVCPMAYSTNYGQSDTWVINIAKKAIGKGNKVVMGLQVYDKATTTRLMTEINHMRTLMKDTTYGDGTLGVVFFRTGTLDYAKVTYDTESKIIAVKLFNESSTKSVTFAQITLQSGLKVVGTCVGDGFKDSAKLTVPTNRGSVKLSGNDIMSADRGYIYIKYEGELDPSKSVATVTFSRSAAAIVYTSYCAKGDANTDMGTPGNFIEIPETTKPKETTASPETTEAPEVTEEITAPMITEAETTAPAVQSKGCGSVMGIGAVISMLLCAAFIFRKKHLGA